MKLLFIGLVYMFKFVINKNYYSNFIIFSNF